MFFIHKDNPDHDDIRWIDPGFNLIEINFRLKSSDGCDVQEWNLGHVPIDPGFNFNEINEARAQISSPFVLRVKKFISLTLFFKINLVVSIIIRIFVSEIRDKHILLNN